MMIRHRAAAGVLNREASNGAPKMGRTAMSDGLVIGTPEPAAIRTAGAAAKATPVSVSAAMTPAKGLIRLSAATLTSLPAKRPHLPRLLNGVRPSHRRIIIRTI